MNEWRIRPWRPEDKPQLTALWQSVFGDDEDYVATYNSLFLKPEGCIVAEADRKVVSAMYVMDGPALALGGGRSLSTAYTYALATAPAWRGRGIGAAVYKACVDTALKRAEVSCVLPAERELYPFYKKAAESFPLSFVREARLTPDVFQNTPRVSLELLLPEEYEQCRERILKGRPHAVMTEDFYVLESYQTARFGGGFYAAGNTLATVEANEGVCRVIELLAPDGNGMAALAVIADAFPANEISVRSPVFFDGPGAVRPFHLAVPRPGAAVDVPRDLWWGFSFD